MRYMGKRKKNKGFDFRPVPLEVIRNIWNESFQEVIQVGPQHSLKVRMWLLAAGSLSARALQVDEISKGKGRDYVEKHEP